jgi:glucokinase
VSENLVVGADVGGTSVKFVVADAAGQRLLQGDIPTDPEAPVQTIARLADRVRGDLPAGADLAGVGLACAGIVSVDTGLLGRSPNLPGWQGHDLGAALGAAFGDVPHVLANDVNAALYGEYRQGAGRDCDHLVMIALGTGVGGGVMVERRLVTGYAHGAGEVGHMTLALDGEPCTCGNQGCLEAYCGHVGMVRRARILAEDPDTTEAWRAMVARQGEALTTRDCHELALAGDGTALAFFAAAGRRLGQAAASLVNALAPDRVIVGGGVAQAGDLLLDPCREMIARHVMSDAGRTTPVVLAELGPHAAAIGAAALAAGPGSAS